MKNVAKEIFINIAISIFTLIICHLFLPFYSFTANILTAICVPTAVVIGVAWRRAVSRKEKNHAD
jgi:hypothetical protein